MGVDSGRLIITDPSYIASEWTSDVVERCHDIVAPPAFGGQITYRRGHKGLGVAFLAGLGDGLYDVYADYADTSLGRRITRVTIELLPHPLERLTTPSRRPGRGQK